MTARLIVSVDPLAFLASDVILTSIYKRRGGWDLLAAEICESDKFETCIV
jgi:hypothetical protein